MEFLAETVRRVVGKGVHRLRSRLMKDLGGGTEDAVIVAGSARSGTTWVAELLREDLKARILFEPLHPRFVPEASHLQDTQYMRPDEDDDALEALMRRILSGHIRGPGWVDRDTRYLRPRKRIVKVVRGCLLLRWLRIRFPSTPQILVIRHPCASVASFLDRGWSGANDVASYLAQPKLLADHIGPRLPLLRSATHDHQLAALVWCVNNRVALAQAGDGDMATFYYENLVAEPAEALPSLFAVLGHRPSDGVFRRLSTPSRTARPGTSFGRNRSGGPRWAKELTATQISDVMEIVDAFGLTGLYDAEGRPTGQTTLPEE